MHLLNGDRLEYAAQFSGGENFLTFSRRSDGAFKICSEENAAAITTVRLIQKIRMGFCH